MRSANSRTVSLSCSHGSSIAVRLLADKTSSDGVFIIVDRYVNEILGNAAARAARPGYALADQGKRDPELSFNAF